MNVAALRKLLRTLWRSYLSVQQSIPESTGPPTNKLDAPFSAYVPFGHALTAWADFERSVDIALWNAIGAGPETGACVTEQVQSIRAKLLMFESIVELKGASKTRLKELRSFRNSLEGITKERNRLIHDPHTPSGFDMVAARASVLKDDSFLHERITVDAILDFAERSYGKTRDWYALYSVILTELGRGPSNEKSE